MGDIFGTVSLCSGIVGILSTVIALFFSVKNNRRVNEADLQKRVETDTRVNMKLDEIINIQHNTAQDIENVKTEIGTQKERIIKVEESVKQAHHRIDGVETRIGG